MPCTVKLPVRDANDVPDDRPDEDESQALVLGMDRYHFDDGAPGFIKIVESDPDNAYDWETFKQNVKEVTDGVDELSVNEIKLYLETSSRR